MQGCLEVTVSASPSPDALGIRTLGMDAPAFSGSAEIKKLVGYGGLEPKAAGVPCISLRCTDLPTVLSCTTTQASRRF
jgi:hypothetical protein